MKFNDLFIENTLTLDWEKIESIKEFARLKDTPHSQRWHKEGSPFQHTRNVVSIMEKRLKNNEDIINHNEIEYKELLLAALCHDLGKATTTKWDEEKQDYVCHNHGAEGARITRNLFFDEEIYSRERVCRLVRWHMALHYILEDKDRLNRKLIELSHHIAFTPLNKLCLLTLCDSLGSENEETDEFIHDKLRQIELRAISLGCLGNTYEFTTDYEKTKFFSDDTKLLPEWSAEENNDFDMYVMIGVPGAGKDTYITKNGLDKYEIISRDLIRTEIGLKGEKPQGNKKEEEEVTRIFNERFLDCCKNHKTFVLNNTNIRRKYRDQYTKMALPYKPHIIYVYVEPPTINECKNRRKGQMPLGVIDRMWKDFEFPDATEYDTLYIDKQ